LTPSATDSFWGKNKEGLLTGAVLFLLVYSVIRNILMAAVRPFWFDELCTWIVARQPKVASIWHALKRAADSQPPPYYILERLFDKLIANDHIAFRMPSILAFCLMEWCLFSLVKRRHNASVAFVASLPPFVTVLYSTYAVEARPYCLVVAFLAAALVAYQRLPSRIWTVLLGLSLAAAACSHYYAVFMTVLFLAVEAVHNLKTKSFRWPVWIALSFGFLPLIFFWPLLARFKAYYSGHAWYGNPTLLGTLKFYAGLFGIFSAGPASPSLPNLIVVLLAVAALVGAALLIYRGLRANPDEQPAFHLDILAAGFLLSPVILLFATRITHGGLAPRYLLPVVPGVALVAGFGLSFLSRKSLALIGALLCVGIASQETQFWLSYYGSYQLGFVVPQPAVDLANSAGHADLPVVVSEGHDYLVLDHYTTPTWKQRFTFLADPNAAVAYGKPDSNDKVLLMLREFAPLRVIEYPQFKASHSQFLLYSDPTWENDPDWFVSWLSADGWALHRLTTDGHSSVYLVTIETMSH